MYRTCIHVDTCSTHSYTYIHVLYMHTRTHMGHTCIHVYACTVHAYTYTVAYTYTHRLQYMHTRVYMYSPCVYVYACMAHVCTCMHVQYMYIVSRASHIFPRMRMCVRKWAGEGKEIYVRAQLPGFRDSLVCAECLPRVRNDY